jgi:hypothetical protein
MSNLVELKPCKCPCGKTPKVSKFSDYPDGDRWSVSCGTSDLSASTYGFVHQFTRRAKGKENAIRLWNKDMVAWNRRTQ